MAFRLRSLLGLLSVLCAMALPASAQGAEPARALLNLDYNLDQSGPSPAALNSLDLYLPAEPDGGPGGLRPVVVWVHGGGWMIGDKSNRMANKVKYFNDLGFIVASLNYRLSPDISGSDTSQAFAPGRVRSPDHVADVAEAIGWLSRNLPGYGGDPDRLVLIGHSAGAHLVSLAATNPTWIERRKVSPRQVLGVVSLDTETFDVREEADATNPLNSAQRLALIWHVFGSPAEEAVEPRWDISSPQVSADRSDPPFLLVTQASRPLRIASNNEMAVALGQDPATAVLGVPLDHEGINTALGSPSDSTVETARVGEFVRGVVAAAQPVGLKIIRRPAKKIVVKVRRGVRKQALRRLRSKVAFAFRGTGRAAGFQCRIDRRPYSRCKSPVRYRLKRGSHTFRVRPLYPSGRPGNERKVTFRIVARRRN